MSRSRLNFDDAFASLLEARTRVAATRPPVRSEPLRRSASVRGIDGAGETLAAPPDDRTEALRRAYADEEPAALTLPEDCDPDALARELGLSEDLTTREIERIRRSFALANHPDRVQAIQRDLATRRMTVANMLIDRALAQRRGKAGR